MLVICICLQRSLTKMAYWQTASSTCECGQHYIEQLMAPLPKTLADKLTSAICAGRGVTLTDLRAIKSLI